MRRITKPNKFIVSMGSGFRIIELDVRVRKRISSCTGPVFCRENAGTYTFTDPKRDAKNGWGIDVPFVAILGNWVGLYVVPRSVCL